MASDREKAEWLWNTMQILSEEKFERDFNFLIKRHQISVLVEMIERRDFKGL